MENSAQKKNKVLCKICKLTYSSFASLRTHLQFVHNARMVQDKLIRKKPLTVPAEQHACEDPDGCEVCLKSISAPKARHVCGICKCSYSTYSNLNTHLKNVHSAHVVKNPRLLERRALPSEKTTYKCLNGCEVSFKSTLDLIDHLKLNHEEELGILPGLTCRRFSNNEDFVQWLHSEEEKHNVQYTKTNKKKTNDEIITYFKCSRTSKNNQFKNQPSQRKRATKQQGSSKITNAACTSYIRLGVDVVTNQHDVDYFSYHYGHNIELRHLRIDKNTRKVIAEKLAQGLSASRIVADIRSTVTPEISLRAHMITRKDVWNIKKAFKINTDNGQRQSEDFKNVKEWVNECFSKDNNPILFYKEPGTDLTLSPFQTNVQFQKQDLCLIIMNDGQVDLLKKFGSNLICIDSTYGTTGYDYELSSLSIVNDLGQGCPCAFMWTNRKDPQIFEFFFSAVSCVTGTIYCTTFMSDMCSLFYNAWSKAMSAPQNQLYCDWHVDRAWQQNLVRISGKDSAEMKRNRELVYNMCKTLQMLSDEVHFRKCYEEFLIELQENEHTAAFYEYFSSGFGSNPELWASCYRQSLGITTNVYLESMRGIREYEHLEGENVMRSDKSIDGILQFLRDKEFGHLEKSTEDKVAACINNINICHEKAIISTFQINNMSDEKCQVDDYVVEKVNGTICCELICNICAICLHSFKCTCVDFHTKNTICEHIHFVNVNKTSRGSLPESMDFAENLLDHSSDSTENLQLHFINSTENAENLQEYFGEFTENLQDHFSESTDYLQDHFSDSTEHLQDHSCDINISLESLSTEPLSVEDLQRDGIAEASTIANSLKFINDPDKLQLALKIMKDLSAMLLDSNDILESAGTSPERSNEPLDENIAEAGGFSSHEEIQTRKSTRESSNIQEKDNAKVNVEASFPFILSEVGMEHYYW